MISGWGQPIASTAPGFGYDAAGNLLSDGVHTYTYDAEGNVTAVDGGTTGQYLYNALNQKVRAQTPSVTWEFVFDTAGRVTSGWTSPTTANFSHVFWDGTQIAYRAQNGTTYFTHGNWVDTDRVHTNPTGAAAASITSLPFGDGVSVSYSDPYASWDYKFADRDYNLESGTKSRAVPTICKRGGPLDEPRPVQRQLRFHQSAEPESVCVRAE